MTENWSENNLPSKARRNTIHTEHLRVHQSNRSLQGKNGPGVGKHWIPGLGVAIPAPGITVAGVQILMVSQKSLEVELVFVQMISEWFQVSAGPYSPGK